MGRHCTHFRLGENLILLLNEETNLRHLEALADLLFAYINKDDDDSYDLEITAVSQAVQILLEEYTGDKYTEAFFLRCQRILLDRSIKISKPDML